MALSSHKTQDPSGITRSSSYIYSYKKIFQGFWLKSQKEGWVETYKKVESQDDLKSQVQ